MSRATRVYRSERRAADAAHTRQRILDAARRLFVQHGYAATTVRAIAAEAGVAEPTVYAVYGSKTAIVAALNDALDDGAGKAEFVTEIAQAADDPARQIALFVRFDRRLFERGADILELVVTSAGVAPELAEVMTRGYQRAREGRERLVSGWRRQGLLNPALSEADAVAIASSLCDYQLYRRLVHEYGWSPDRYERWLTDTLCAQLLRQEPDRS